MSDQKSDLERESDEVNARYAGMAAKQAEQVARLKTALGGMRAKLVLTKNRLHDEIQEGAEVSVHDAYTEVCARIGRIDQQLGNLEALEQNDGRFSDPRGDGSPAKE